MRSRFAKPVLLCAIPPSCESMISIPPTFRSTWMMAGLLDVSTYSGQFGIKRKTPLKQAVTPLIRSSWTSSGQQTCWQFYLINREGNVIFNAFVFFNKSSSIHFTKPIISSTPSAGTVITANARGMALRRLPLSILSPRASYSATYLSESGTSTCWH